MDKEKSVNSTQMDGIIDDKMDKKWKRAKAKITHLTHQKIHAKKEKLHVKEELKNLTMHLQHEKHKSNEASNQSTSSTLSPTSMYTTTTATSTNASTEIPTSKNSLTYSKTQQVMATKSMVNKL